MELIYIVEGLAALILLVMGWNVKALYNRLDKVDIKHEKLRDNFNTEMKDVYSKHDQATDALRREMNNLGASLRDAISDSSNKTNDLLIQILRPNQ